MLKENGCQESFIGKVFKRITNNHSLSQSQQQTKVTEIQEEETRMSKNLPDGDDTIEKLRRILRSLKTLFANYFVNRKMEWLQKAKLISLMILTVVTAKQSSSVNLNRI